MTFFIVVSCAVWICCVSSATSALLNHGFRHGQNIDEILQEHDIKDRTQEENLSKLKKNIMREHIQSMDHGEQKMSSSPPEFLLNINNEKNENNSVLHLNSNLSHNININKHAKVQESEDYQDAFEDAVGTLITEYPKGKLKSSMYESDDEQSGDGPTSLALSEEHGNSLMDSNIQDVELEEVVNNDYKNILEKTLDEDLKYILNFTYNNMGEEQLRNKTNKVLITKELNREDIGSISASEGETSISKQYGGSKDGDDDEESLYSSKTENQHFVHEQDEIKMKSHVSGIALVQKGSVEGEETTDLPQKKTVRETHKVRGDVPHVEDSNKMIGYWESENTTDKITVTSSLLEQSHITSSEIQAHHPNHDFDADMKKEISNLHTNKTKPLPDPCANFHCKKGKTCKTDEQGTPLCACQDPELCQPANLNDRVCGTDNKTYTSDCHLFAAKCQLEGTKEGSQLHLDYQGPCKYIPPCTDYELAHFPFRMRDWLKNVLVQLYERGQENAELLSEKQRNKVKKIYEDERRLHKGYHNIELLEKDFQKNYHMYVYPVHWQFNQLDHHSTDRLLTRSELSALRAPLIPMEHCVTTFLHGCNTNNDKHISLQEWCHCFGIRDGDIDEDLLF